MLPREVVDLPSLELFKARFGGALSSLTFLKVSLTMAVELDSIIFKVPSKSNLSMIHSKMKKCL